MACKQEIHGLTKLSLIGKGYCTVTYHPAKFENFVLQGGQIIQVAVRMMDLLKLVSKVSGIHAVPVNST